MGGGKEAGVLTALAASPGIAGAGVARMGGLAQAADRRRHRQRWCMAAGGCWGQGARHLAQHGLPNAPQLTRGGLRPLLVDRIGPSSRWLAPHHLGSLVGVTSSAQEAGAGVGAPQNLPMRWPLMRVSSAIRCAPALMLC